MTQGQAGTAPKIDTFSHLALGLHSLYDFRTSSDKVLVGTLFGTLFFALFMKKKEEKRKWPSGKKLLNVWVTWHAREFCRPCDMIG
jgi:hypothetical protein